MKIKASNIIWGFLFVLAGVFLFCNAFFDTDLSLWGIVWRFWPLAIIVPNLIGFFTSEKKTSSLIWFLIGVALILLTNDLISADTIQKLFLPVLFVIIGFSLVFKGVFSKKPSVDSNHHFSSDETGAYQSSYTTSTDKNEYNAIFGSSQDKFPNEIFTGAEVNSVFGSVVLDLRDAIITSDAVINASVFFAGADIYVPANVNVKVSSVPIFGGVSNKVPKKDNAGPTLYINATCMFGGLEIK